MSVYLGKNGVIRFDGKLVTFRASWNIEIMRQTIPDTPIAATNGYNKYRTSFKDWFATVNCYINKNGTDISIDDEGVLRIESGGVAPRFQGDCICIDKRMHADAKGFAMVEYSFQGNGELTEY